MSADLTQTDSEVRAEVLRAAKALHAAGLVVGTAGNVSGRLADRHTACMTPSSLGYEGMTEDDLVVVDLDGTVVAGSGSPTSEKALHLECYKRYPEVGGVIHSHAPYASMFAVAGKPVPAAVEEAITYLGGDIPLCSYEPSGSDALGREAASQLADRSAALLANHGLVCVGKSPDDALHASLVAEHTARIIWGASALGEPVPVPQESIANLGSVYSFVRNQMWPQPG